MKPNTLIVLSFILVTYSSCTLAPRYIRPQAPIPENWPERMGYIPGETSIQQAENPQMLGWREFYVDKKMQQVITLALENNRDLRLAAQNVEMARALYGIQRDAVFPAITVSADGVKQQSATDLTQEGYSRTSEFYEMNLGVLAWEIDFFGRIRSLKDRALEEYMATEQARRSAQILLISSVADTYLALAADRENLALAVTTFDNQKTVCSLIQRQYEVGIATELDLRQAQIPMYSAQRDIARYTQFVAMDINALNLLVGIQVPDELLPQSLDDICPPASLSPGLSSEILLNRPDVMQSECILKAANANIGAARAALFPKISLTGLMGFASGDLSRLFDSGNDTWTVTPQIIAPVFDPRSWSALNASKVQYQMIVTQYEKTIQKAFREVADALALCGTINQQLDAQRSLVGALETTRRLSQLRYEEGIDSYLGVLDAQRSLFAAQQGFVSLRQAQLTSQMRLFAVLGGGYDNGEPAPESLMDATIFDAPSSGN